MDRVEALYQALRLVRRSRASRRRWVTGGPAVMLLPGTALLFGQGVSMSLGFVTVFLLARTLGARGYGVYTYVMAWTNLLGVPALLGLDRLAVREISRYRLVEDWRSIRGLVRWGNWCVGLLAVSLGVVGVCIAWLAGHGESVIVFCVGMALVPITALTSLRQAIMQAFDRPVVSQLPELIVRPVALVGLLITMWELLDLSRGAGVAMCAAVASSGVAFAVGAAALGKSLPREVGHAEPVYRPRYWLKSAVPMLLLGSVWLVNSYIATVVLGLLGTSSEVGVYSVASNAASIVSIPLSALLIPLAPHVARLWSFQDRLSLVSAAVRCARLSTICALVLAGGMATFGRPVLGILGHDFVNARDPLVILSIGEVLNCAFGPVALVLMMAGHERRAALAMAAGSTSLLIADVLLVPSLGAVGASIGTVLSIVVWNGIMSVHASRALGICTNVLGVWRRG